MTEFRSGIVAVVGRPNVGKSTLVNRLVGTKISIVTAKPQTTRHAIHGVVNEDDTQIVLVDTPGLHESSGRLLNRAMNRAAAGSLDGCDLALLLVEAGKWNRGDDSVLERIAEQELPCVLLVNKVDRVHPKEKLLPYLAECSKRYDFVEVVPISAEKGSNTAQLTTLIRPHLTETMPLYPDDMNTNLGREMRIAETLREKLMATLQAEVPYGLAVQVETVEEDGDMLRVGAVVWVDKTSHKPIILGQRGERLKKVSTAARKDLEQQFDRRFYLRAFVKVKSNWADSAQVLQQMGHDV